MYGMVKYMTALFTVVGRGEGVQNLIQLFVCNLTSKFTPKTTFE